MTTFLPNGYESLKLTKAYWKMSEMKETGSRLRIVMKPIAGWLDWVESKPKRYRPDQKPQKAFDADKPIKPFWDLYVWDYAREGLFILEITQMSLIKALTKIATDEDWGDFLEYDLKITKEGAGKDTRYTLTPLPHKPFSEKTVEALKKAPVRLEALYDGGDPWTDLKGPVDEVTGEVVNPSSILESDVELHSIHDLAKCLEAEGIDTEALGSYLEDLSAKKKQTVHYIIGSALAPQLFPKFKNAYLKELERRAVQSELAAV
jgi:hypothetical protein